MTLFQKIAAAILEKVLVLCGVLGVLLPTSPANMLLTTRDSGVFLYIGWRILNGELPYRDLWDHKPPLVFYINALGLFLSNNSRWGVWWIEFFTLTLAAMLGFYLIKKALGTIPAILSSLLWLLTLLFVIKGGNFTTEYILPLQFAALWLVYDIDKPGASNWRYFLLGVIGALAFFTKQTAIGIWMAAIIYLTIQRFTSRQIKRWGRELFFLSAGTLTITLGIVVFFGAQGALPQFWSAAFQYNFVYSSTITGFTNRLKPLLDGIAPLTSTGLFQLSMIGYVFAVIAMLFKRSVIEKQLPLLAIGLIDLPIELILVSASGNIYIHYYMTVLPALALFAGILFWICYSQLEGWGIANSAKYVFVIGIMGIFWWSSFRNYQNQVTEFSDVNDETAINYIKAVTTPDDDVLLWGAESLTNYFAQRKSPTRFVYQYPLYKRGYANEQMIEEFLDDIIQNHPQLIIDTKNSATPMYDFPIHTPAIDTRIAILQSHYHAVKKIGDWIVYEDTEDNP